MWKDERSEEQDGGRRYGRSLMVSGMGSHTQHRGSRSQSGSEYTDKVNEDEIDIAISPSKPLWSSSKNGKGGTKLADKIRNQRMEEEIARKVREIAFDAGLIGLGGVIVERVEHITLHELPEQDVG